MYMCGYVFLCAVEGGNTSNDWVFKYLRSDVFTMFYYVLLRLSFFADFYLCFVELFSWPLYCGIRVESKGKFFFCAFIKFFC